MSEEENILWKKISSFKLDEEDSSFKFSTRLARENGWTIAFSKQVIEEYKKFIFLCCITKSGVTPSDQVDQAWHLHLTYTKSYWTDLCKNTLGRELHHNPTKGGQKEGEKFNDFYTDTIKLYREKFRSDPPKNIWPDNAKRFSDIDFQRVNLKNYWTVPRPAFNKNHITLFCIILFALLCIQSSSDGGWPVIGVIGFFALIIWSIFKNKGGGSGCSTSGCEGNSGCNSSSGCSNSSDSGCSGGSGCSGCGGGD